MESLFWDDAWGDMRNLSLQEMDDYRQLHQLAVAIYQKQQIINGYLDTIGDADAVVDWNALTGAANAMLQLKQQFTSLRSRIDQNTRAQNQLGMLDRVILSVGTYAEQVLNALARALAAIPNAFIRAMGEIAKEGGRTMTEAAVSWLIPIAIGLVVLKQLESSPSVRAGVKAYTRRR